MVQLIAEIAAVAAVIAGVYMMLGLPAALITGGLLYLVGSMTMAD